MSTVNGLNSSSIFYSPTLNSYTNESNFLNDSNMSSGTSTPDLTSLSSEMSQLDLGINPEEAVKYEPTSTSSTSITQNDAIAGALKQNPQYSSEVLNLNSEQSLIQSLNGRSNTDSLTELGSELNLLNEGINESQIPSIAGIVSQNSAAPNIISLGEQLNQLNTGVIGNNGASQVLNYNYSPSSGITKNLASNTTGSNLDLKL